MSWGYRQGGWVNFEDGDRERGLELFESRDVRHTSLQATAVRIISAYGCCSDSGGELFLQRSRRSGCCCLGVLLSRVDINLSADVFDIVHDAQVCMGGVSCVM
ncbi:hypothetical protein VOLCADRAFT_98077 [Volvox carteri f. nagariensis]|uniref:Uncharacterized protein n=1 Tax=Volvox carteri f. nagariensis TaxID=3068 RepID=D8UED8_VOLCA|nr:uncharacterized protein VOLCADRAFT_98077 [Volvox carteri f. nagariensis]EFJ41949.1 hypothetical protein VOLCADRAFT_98077 [Volvox carteri f. nagariensis]|eukprot:XP_002956986.1 hypothetical protein VOLCADRAFT_98077 [Volvox carteri f. nagariensis]